MTSKNNPFEKIIIVLSFSYCGHKNHGTGRCAGPKSFIKLKFMKKNVIVPLARDESGGFSMSRSCVTKEPSPCYTH